MTRRVLFAFGLCSLACSSGADGARPSTTDASSTNPATTRATFGSSDTGPADTTAASIDGTTTATTLDTTDGPQDCNGPAVGGSPGDPEICDGIDQDCDDLIDEGVPNDGAGCVDPGAPLDPPEIDEIHITVHTADLQYAGTDDAIDVCFPEIGLCDNLGVPDWNDRERGRYDVVQLSGNGASIDDVMSMTITTPVGNDRWEPQGFEVVIDGTPVYCRDELDIFIGTGGVAELQQWQDPESFALHCNTVWPAVLTHGPMVGSVGHDSVMIWYRTDATRRTLLRVAAEEAALQDAPVVDYGYPSYTEDFAETVEVAGLLPDTDYYYDLEIEGERFGPWPFRTAPEAGAPANFRLAFGSCAGDDDQPIFQSVRAWNPDVFLFAGDNHYANSSDLSALRQHYRWVRERPGRGELLHEASIIAIWDDHDYVGNNADGTAPGKAIALEAFTEYWANRTYGTDVTPGTFGIYSYGDIDIFMTDDRYYRGLDDSIIGDAQEQWLFDALVASTATFKLVLSGSQFTLEGTLDSWGVYPAAQTRLRAHIADQDITGVILLSGDIHRSEFRMLPATLGGYPLPELTSSPMARGNSNCPVGDPEIITCFTDDDFFMGLEIDTTLADPQLVATIFDVGGAPLADWTILRSQLE